MFTEILLQSSDELTQELPKVLLAESSNMDKILYLWDLATANIIKYGPRVLSYILQFDGKFYGEKHFFSKDPFFSVIKTLIDHAQKTGEISSLNDPEMLFYVIHTYFVGNNLNWASSDGAYDYTEQLHIGIQYILSDTRINPDSPNNCQDNVRMLLGAPV